MCQRHPKFPVFCGSGRTQKAIDLPPRRNDRFHVTTETTGRKSFFAAPVS
jgi:hypothetical protein